MVRARRNLLVNVFLVLVVAMASLHFAAHADRPAAIDPDLATYLAMGGSLSDLCLSEDPEQGHAECPFCREADYVALVSPAPETAPAVFGEDRLLERVTAVVAQAAPVSLPPARAPPTA